MDKNEIVKYNNYMNTLNFKNFGVSDFDFLMVLCAKLKDKGTDKVTLTFVELRYLTGYKQTSNEQFIKDLRRMNEKLQKVTACIETKQEILSFVLFPTFVIHKEKQTLTICVNEYFKFILNDVVQNFTIFELLEFTSLSSKYSKTLYRLLKQWRTQGEYIFHDIADFREKMDIPESFSNKIMIRDCIKRAVEEISALNKSFENFKFECMYDIHKRGKPLVGLKFSWKAEERKAIERNDPFPPSKSKNYKKSKFTDIEQHNYDYKELEKKLLNTNNFSL